MLQKFFTVAGWSEYSTALCKSVWEKTVNWTDRKPVFNVVILAFCTPFGVSRAVCAPIYAWLRRGRIPYAWELNGAALLSTKFC